MRTSVAVPVLLVLFAACESAAEPAPQQFLSLGIANSFAPGNGVFCSGQPTEEQFAKLADAGIVRVISLRAAEEKGSGWEEAKARELGIGFVRIPVAGEAGITVDNAQALARQLAAAPGPVLVSCASSNRVGALFALKAHYVDGKPADEALAFGRSCGLVKAEPTVAKILGR